jgi:hypothetical protein
MACGLPELLELDDELLLEEEPPLEVHGCTATVWIGEPRGMMMRLEPSGGLDVLLVLPTPPVAWLLVFDWPAVGQGGTITLTSLRCLARRTVRTPGVWRAIETMSVALEDEPLLLELLLPHAAMTSTIAMTAATPNAVRTTRLPNLAIEPPLAIASIVVPHSYPRRAIGNLPAAGRFSRGWVRRR